MVTLKRTWCTSSILFHSYCDGNSLGQMHADAKDDFSLACIGSENTSRAMANLTWY